MRSASLLGLVAINIGLALSHPFYHNSTVKAAYFQDDDPAGSSIIALQISATDGTLSNPVRTASGGKGLADLVAVFQDSVIVSENFLFTINAGDETLSMFVIDPADPLHPSLVGTPAPTLGETPISVAYSSRIKTACVFNAGKIAGVTCYSVDKIKGLTALGGLRPLPQTEDPNPSPPPTAPFILGKDIVFNPSSTALFVSVGSNPKRPGLLYAFPVLNKTVSTHYIVSSLPTIPGIFSLNFLDNDDTHLLATDPEPGKPGAAFLQISYPSLQATLAKTITVPGQTALCWAAYAPHYDAAYLLDAAKTIITIINPETGDVIGQVPFTDPNSASVNPGAQDSKVLGDYLYVSGVSALPTIYVYKIDGPALLTQVQVFVDFKAVGPIPFWFGMATWPSTGY